MEYHGRGEESFPAGVGHRTLSQGCTAFFPQDYTARKHSSCPTLSISNVLSTPWRHLCKHKINEVEIYTLGGLTWSKLEHRMPLRGGSSICLHLLFWNINYLSWLLMIEKKEQNTLDFSLWKHLKGLVCCLHDWGKLTTRQSYSVYFV